MSSKPKPRRGSPKRSGNCETCGLFRERLQRDHKIPVFEGGVDSDDNFQWLCANCHQDKTREDQKRWRPTEAMRLKMSIGSKSAWRDGRQAPRLEKLSESSRRAWANGRVWSKNPEESKKRMSEAQKKVWARPDHVWPKDVDTTRQKMSLSARRRWSLTTDEMKEKTRQFLSETSRRAWLNGRPWSYTPEESKKKASEAQKKRAAFL